MPAHQNNLFDGKAETGVKFLGDKGQLAGQIPFVIGQQRFFPEFDTPAVRFFAAGQEIKKSCFAAAIRTDDTIKLAGWKNKVNIVKNQGPSVGKRYPFNAE